MGPISADRTEPLGAVRRKQVSIMLRNILTPARVHGI